MKYLHIFNYDVNHKFSKDLVNLIENEIDNQNHSYIQLISEETSCINKDFSKLKPYHLSFKNFKSSKKLLKDYDKIFIHGLSDDIRILIFLAINKKLLKKSYWIIWGGDLYIHNSGKRNYKFHVKEILRKIIIKRFYGLISQIKGDYDLAREWYGAKGKYFYSFMYLSNTVKNLETNRSNDTNSLVIQVGNSACSTNLHKEVFTMLEKYSERTFDIVCPLSYAGNPQYINSVIEEGIKVFGENRFRAITDFMSLEQYNNLQAEVDIAIFNHRRQRGLGNIITLLGMGRKVYIRKDITTWSFAEEHGLTVYSIENDMDTLFHFDDKALNRNRVIIEKLFSKEKLVNDWKKIFEY